MPEWLEPVLRAHGTYGHRDHEGRRIVVTKGEGGCALYRGDEPPLLVPAPAVDVEPGGGAG